MCFGKKIRDEGALHFRSGCDRHLLADHALREVFPSRLLVENLISLMSPALLVQHRGRSVGIEDFRRICGYSVGRRRLLLQDVVQRVVVSNLAGQSWQGTLHGQLSLGFCANHRHIQVLIERVSASVLFLDQSYYHISTNGRARDQGRRHLALRFQNHGDDVADLGRAARKLCAAGSFHAPQFKQYIRKRQHEHRGVAPCSSPAALQESRFPQNVSVLFLCGLLRAIALFPCLLQNKTYQAEATRRRGHQLQVGGLAFVDVLAAKACPHIVGESDAWLLRTILVEDARVARPAQRQRAIAAHFLVAAGLASVIVALHVVRTTKQIQTLAAQPDSAPPVFQLFLEESLRKVRLATVPRTHPKLFQKDFVPKKVSDLRLRQAEKLFGSVWKSRVHANGTT